MKETPIPVMFTEAEALTIINGLNDLIKLVGVGQGVDRIASILLVIQKIQKTAMQVKEANEKKDLPKKEDLEATSSEVTPIKKTTRARKPRSK